GKHEGKEGVDDDNDDDDDEEAGLKRELIRLGAEKVVTERELVGKGFKEQVAEWTRGGREEVKLGLNCVGGEAALAMAKILSDRATMVTYGAMSRAPMRLGASMLIFRDLRFRGFWLTSWADSYPDARKETVEHILRMYREGTLVDAPTVDVPWDWHTSKDDLLGAVQGTLEGYREGKGIFVFGDT
ncbi:MAG: hypothetical protein Q9163_006336, partial [Psora crenata]